MNPVTFKTSTVVGVLLDHGLGEALLLRTLLLRSPTVLLTNEIGHETALMSTIKKLSVE